MPDEHLIALEPYALLYTRAGACLLYTSTPVVFGFGGEGTQEFMLNGKPFQIRGAEMHPQRIPREYWRHRSRTAKAMGLNTIAFYVFWNDHEQPDGSFDFKTGFVCKSSYLIRDFDINSYGGKNEACQYVVGLKKSD